MRRSEKRLSKSGSVTLKTVAEHVGLATGTVSLILNHAPGARSIPQTTKDRVLTAARELNYRPNFFARALRAKTSATGNGTAREIASSSGALMFGNAENFLRAIQAIQQAGLRVPGDVSVLGVDGFPEA